MQFLRRSKDWKQVSAVTHGGSKARSARSIKKSLAKAGTQNVGTGYGGHFRAVQGFKYIGPPLSQP